MAKINNDEQKKIKNFFEEKMVGDVRILFFSDEDECEYCDDTKEILTEVAGLDDRISLETYTLDDDKAAEYGIDRAPATIFVDKDGNDLNVHFYGIPSGYEFNTLIEDIIDISSGNPDLPEDVMEEVEKIEEDVLLQVFITPTCPYCPRAVRVAHAMAMANPRIRGEMVEAIEFRELSDKYNVSGVPKTVINSGAAEQVGAVPAQVILDKIKESL
jgi:glutaredoxin-like protein